MLIERFRAWIAGRSLVDTIERIKRSVFPLTYGRIRQEGELVPEDKLDVQGTGFLVGKEGYFVTAGHVARVMLDATNREPGRVGIVMIPKKAWGKGVEIFDVWFLEFRVIQIDEGSDLALCRTVQNPFVRDEIKCFVRSVVLTDTIPPDGTEAGFTGFPINNKIPLSGKGTLASYQGFPGRGVVFLLHADSWPGVSGSPLYLIDGHVIGLVTARGHKVFQGVTLARPTGFIKDFLNANRVAH